MVTGPGDTSTGFGDIWLQLCPGRDSCQNSCRITLRATLNQREGRALDKTRWVFHRQNNPKEQDESGPGMTHRDRIKMISIPRDSWHHWIGAARPRAALSCLSFGVSRPPDWRSQEEIPDAEVWE